MHDLQPFFREEDFFPREFTNAHERPWGVMYHNPDNPDSYDSNHALIFRDKVKNLPAVLREIADFYISRGLKPIVYQSILDDGWFGEIAQELSDAGFRSWQEEQQWMLLAQDSAIRATADVRRLTAWDEDLAAYLYNAAGEPWEIAVAKRQLENDNTLFFAVFVEGKPVGAIYGHVNADGICRIDYLLVATAHRGNGLGRALTHYFVTHCRENHIPCALWPDGTTPERIYQEAGFRFVRRMIAGRAVWKPGVSQENT